MSNFVNRWSKVIRELPMGEQPSPADSAAPGGDVEQKAESLIDAAFNDGTGYSFSEHHIPKSVARKAVIAALSAPKHVRPDPSLCHHRFGADARVCLLCGWDFRENGDAPQPVEAEGREPFGWFLGDVNGVGRFKRDPTPQTIADYQSTEGYSATPLYTTPPPEQPAIDPKDSERLDWMMAHVSGKELRDMGIHTFDGCTRECIDTAIIDGAKAGLAEGEES